MSISLSLISYTWSRASDRATCPNFVKKLFARFNDVTARSSLALSAWANANAPSSLISLKPRSSEVKDSLIILKLRAKHMAPFRIGTCQQAKHGSCTKVQITNGNTKRDCAYIISKTIRPQIQCWQCCVVLQTISNELCTLHTYLQDMQLCWRGKNTQMVKLLVQFYSVLRITWHQPSLRVWIFPWNLRTSHKAFTPSDPIGL